MRKDTMNAIAHEVRTPLAAILGYAENLRLGIAEDKKDYYLEQIEVKGNEISRMIDEILSLAKLEDSDCSLMPEALSINSLIFEITSGMDAVFRIEEKDEWFIDADREYIIRMLKCLLDNAVRYRTPDTAVTITIGRYFLLIHNQCEPLSEETLNQIFEFRAKNDGRYSFGLFFCRKAAAANGLKLRIYNENDGVTVSLY
jgi:signal transduction histidine kinase